MKEITVSFAKIFTVCHNDFFPRDVLDEILNLIESVSEGFPSYFGKLSILKIPLSLQISNTNVCVENNQLGKP